MKISIALFLMALSVTAEAANMSDRAQSFKGRYRVAQDSQNKCHIKPGTILEFGIRNSPYKGQTEIVFFETVPWNSTYDYLTAFSVYVMDGEVGFAGQPTANAMVHKVSYGSYSITNDFWIRTVNGRDPVFWCKKYLSRSATGNRVFFKYTNSQKLQERECHLYKVN